MAPSLRRRSYLRAAGAAGAGSLVVPSSGAAVATAAGDGRNGERQDFVWLNGALTRNDRIFENVLAFMQRHGLAGIISAAETSRETAERIEPILARTGERDIPTWLASGCFKREFTAAQLVDDETAMATFLDRLATVTETYARHQPRGKFVCWHEAPLVSNWAEEDVPYEFAVRNMAVLGQDIFAAQKRRIQEVAPEVDVGVFVHFPYIAERHEFEQLTDGLRERGALPDFSFTDFYRGYREVENGVAAANRIVRDLIANARKHTDGRAVYYLGEDHTINNNYTPSKQAIRENHRAALGADGLGWYSRGQYRQTKRGFNPFIPNTGTVDDDRFTTLVGSRDRFQYAYRLSNASRQGVDPTNRFDLWLYGEDFEFYDHRLSLRAPDGWTFVGDFSGYLGAQYGGDGREWVSVFHGLSRDRFLADGTLAWRVDSRQEGDGATLDGVWAMPHDTANYVSEPAAVDLVRENDLDPYALGSHDESLPLDPGARVTRETPVGGVDRGLGELLYPRYAGVRDRLAAFERCDRFEPGRVVDLWVSGRGLAAGDIGDSLYTAVGDERVRLADRSAAVAATDRLAIFYGVERTVTDEYLDRALDFVVAAPEGEAPQPEQMLAMPYFGSGNFTSPERAAELVAADELAAERFAVASFGFFGREPDAEPTAAGSTLCSRDWRRSLPSTTTATFPEFTTAGDTVARRTRNAGTPGFGVAAALGALGAGALARLRGKL
ncbi:MAG: hypothetical protein ABEH77_01850 [Halobacteriaceae archaeon]